MKSFQKLIAEANTAGTQLQFLIPDPKDIHKQMNDQLRGIGHQIWKMLNDNGWKSNTKSKFSMSGGVAGMRADCHKTFASGKTGYLSVYLDWDVHQKTKEGTVRSMQYAIGTTTDGKYHEIKTARDLVQFMAKVQKAATR